MKTLVSVLLAAGCAGAVCGCWGRAGTPPAAATMVFIDLETNQPVVQGATRDAPAVNAKTGRRTLMPALYCASCGTWHPAPPLDVAQRTPDALRCPQCKSRLTAESPLPDSPEDRPE